MTAVYYHGGAPDLTVVLPPMLTGVVSCADYGAAVCRRDRVYVTTAYEAALMWAVGHPSGDGVVYVVRPVHPLEHDDDCDVTQLSYACRKAVVVDVIKPTATERAAVLSFLMETEPTP